MMPKHYILRAVVLVLFTLVLAGCSAAQESQEKMIKPSEEIAFSGRVVWVELEGGFWAIETDGGKKLDPRTLDTQFAKDNLKVSGRYRVLKDVMTIRMWGTPVEITAIAAEE